ncbi:MAG: GNAT family N-acetyltransferase [Candidatus Micrarchaeales archaeon]
MAYRSANGQAAAVQVPRTLENASTQKMAVVDPKPIDANELKKVYALAKEEYSKFFSGIGAWFDKYWDNDELCSGLRPIWVARDNGKIVGFMVTKFPSTKDVKINYLFVLPEYGKEPMVEFVQLLEKVVIDNKLRKIHKHIYREREAIEMPVFERLGYYRGRYKGEEAKIPEDQRARKMMVKKFPVPAPQVVPDETRLKIRVLVTATKSIEVAIRNDSVSVDYHDEEQDLHQPLVQKMRSMIRR